MAVSAEQEVRSFEVVKEEKIAASVEVVFETILEQMGPYNETPDGTSLAMKLEAWPGGRWYRDLGDNNGHFWGHVQAIKRPTLVEIAGPLFASYPLVSNVQYRLTEADGGTLISFRHTALGFMQEDQKQGATKGWKWILEKAVARAEGR